MNASRNALILAALLLIATLPARAEIGVWQRDSCEDEVTQFLIHKYVGGSRGDWLYGYDNMRVDSMILGSGSVSVYAAFKNSVDSIGRRTPVVYATSDIDSITFIRNHGYELLNYPAEGQLFHVGDTVWFQWANDFRDMMNDQYGTWPSVAIGLGPHSGAPYTPDCRTANRIVADTAMDSFQLPSWTEGTQCSDGSTGNGDYRRGVVGHWPWVIRDSVYNSYPPSQYAARSTTVSDSAKLFLLAFFATQHMRIATGEPENPVHCLEEPMISTMPHYFTIRP